MPHTTPIMMKSPYFILSKFSLLACLVILNTNVATSKPKLSPTVTQTTIKKSNLYDRASLLGSGNYWTIVPKKSVINLPDSLRGKIIPAPKGKYIAFSKFLSRNSRWLHAYPISLDYARGKKSLDKYRFDALKRSNKIVITTHKKDPISLHKNAHPKTDDNIALSKK